MLALRRVFHMICSHSLSLQKEHEESVSALKQQVEAERTRRASVAGPSDAAALQLQLTHVLAEVSALQQQLKERENSLKLKTAELEAGASQPGPAAAAAASDSAPSIAAVRDERDRAVAALAAQSQAWNAEKEELKRQLEDMKLSYTAKLEAVTKITPGNPGDEALAAKLEGMDSVLKDSIRKGDLRGAAVDLVGKVLGARFKRAFALSWRQ